MISKNIAVAATTTWILMVFGANAAGISDDRVRIGVLSDMSGQYSDSGGRGSVEAARMAVEDFGAKVLGKPVEVVFADHQNKADIAAAKARQWWDAEGVDMIIDLNNSAIASAVNVLAKERNKIAIATGALSNALTNEFCAPTAIHYTVRCAGRVDCRQRLRGQDVVLACGLALQLPQPPLQRPARHWPAGGNGCP